MTDTSAPALTRPRLPLGQLVATPGAIAALTAAGMSVFILLNRHARWDWGDLSPEDLALNNLAAITSQRVQSSYLLGNRQKVWIITEWDRSVTTVLLPEDY